MDEATQGSNTEPGGSPATTITTSTMKQFIVTLRHDNGERTVKIYASGIDEATRQVCDAEEAPIGAVTNVQEAPPNTYGCIYNGKEATIKAHTQYEAQLAAAIELKVPKSKHHMIAIGILELGSNPGVPYLNSTLD